MGYLSPSAAQTAKTSQFITFLFEGDFFLTLLFGEDESFGRDFFCGGSAFHDVFDFLVDVFEGVEDGEGDAFSLAVGDQIYFK